MSTPDVFRLAPSTDPGAIPFAVDADNRGDVFQIVKLAYGDDGIATWVSATNPLPHHDATLQQTLLDRLAQVLTIADQSPPLAQLTKGGIDATSVSGTLVIANNSRVRLDVRHAGSANGSRVWLGIDEVPTVGQGIFLDPGDVFQEYTHAAVSLVLDSGATTASERIVFTEWG